MANLDDLAVEPLPVTVGGKEFALELTVETMIKVSKVEEKGDASTMETAIIVMESAGFPRADFMKLQPRQAIRLSELISERFFPQEAAEEKNPTGTESPLTGPTPSLDSSVPSVEPTA